jgi:hypothetical protein
VAAGVLFEGCGRRVLAEVGGGPSGAAVGSAVTTGRARGGS